MRLFTRRQALAGAGQTGAAFTIAPRLVRWAIPGATGGAGGPLNQSQLRTLHAAVAQIVPAVGSGDWSAADVGADNYIVQLLSGTGQIYAGGPVRARFPLFQKLSRVKQIGWGREITRLRTLYQQGLAELDSLAGGDFASALPELQYAVLTLLDDSGSDFFTELFNHTLEGVYSHPVYGGNSDYRAWQAFGYAGDVHGVRYPHIGPADAPWNVYGGYAPEEMVQPGTEST